MGDSSVTRRRALKLLGGTTVGGGIAAAWFSYSAEQTLAANATLSEDTLMMESNAGQLQSLYVQPEIDYRWDGIDNPPERFDFYVEARLPDGDDGAEAFERIGAEGVSLDTDKYESTEMRTYSFENHVSILDHSNISDKHFEKRGSKWKKETTIEIKIITELTVEESGKTYTRVSNTEVSVTLINERGSIHSGGETNPDGSAK
jgi:hypothetical protein